MARSYNRIAASRRTGLPAAGLGTDSVTAAKIAAGAVGTSEIDDGTVAMADLANLAGLSVVGRSASTTGVPAAITGTDGQALRVSGTALGFGTLAAAGIASDAVETAKIKDANVTLAKIANGTGLSVVGRSASTAGVNADIVGTDGQALRVSGTALGFGTIATAGIADAAVTKAKTTIFVSTEQTGNGSAQNVAHGLTGTPAFVFVALTGPTGNAGDAITEGAHDGTNCVVTVTNTAKYRIIAMV